MIEISKSTDLPSRDYRDLKILPAAVVTLKGRALGTTQIMGGGQLSVYGFLNGGALVSPGGLLHIAGYANFAHHTFLEGEVQISGVVNVPAEAERLLPGGHKIYVRPGTIFNVGATQHMLNRNGTLHQLSGSTNITTAQDAWCHYSVATNSFTEVR